MSHDPERCPKCGGTSFMQWCMGWGLTQTRPHSHDPNRRTCVACSATWWPPCPVDGCAWADDQRRVFAPLGADPAKPRA